MAGAHGNEDDLESKLGGLSLVDKRRLSTTKKSRFTQHSGLCAQGLELWENDPGERILGERAKKLPATVREEEAFSEEFKPKMDKMTEKLKELEDSMARALVTGRELIRANRVRDSSRGR